MRAADSPLRRVEIELDPFGLAQFTGAHEHERRKLQGRTRDRHALVALDRSQQLPDPLRIGDRGHVLHEHGLECAAQVRSRIAFGPTGRYRVSEHLTACLQSAMRRFDRPARFDASHGLEQLRCLGLADRQAA
jgi:hypothetical protein